MRGRGESGVHNLWKSREKEHIFSKHCRNVASPELAVHLTREEKRQEEEQITSHCLV